MESEVTARELGALYLDYLSWREQTSHALALKITQPFRKPPKLTDERKQALAAMITWSRAAGRDPRVWLFLMFAVRGWKFAPELSSSHLIQPKWIEAYAKRKSGLSQSPKYRERLVLAQTTAQLPGAIFDPRVDLDGEAEARKERYFLDGDAQRCIDESDVWTYGWHPESTTCSKCPAAKVCQINLDKAAGYPLTRVRKGEMTLGAVGQ